jgi:hypothetical protein
VSSDARNDLACKLAGAPEVGHETRHLGATCSLVRRSEDRRGVDRRERAGHERRTDQLPALTGHAEGGAQQRLGRRGAEADDELRLQRDELRLEPGAAGPDLVGLWLLVDPALPSQLETEMLDDVRQVYGFAVDTGFVERFIQEAAGRSDERLAVAVFTIAGLFTNQDDAGVCVARAVPEHGLRGVLPQPAGTTA